MEWYVKQSTRYFSNAAVFLEDYLQDRREQLQKADIGYSLIQYISMALMSSTVSFIVFAPLISVFTGSMFSTAAGVLSGLILGLFIGLMLSVGVFMGFYVYPSIRISERRDDIDRNLPFATTYLSTIAGSGTPVQAMFKLLGKLGEYGEVSKEAERIANDVYNFGADLDVALSRAAKRTPSEKFKDLLWGINSIVSTGGNMQSFLSEKAESFMNDYKRELDSFTDTLSLLVEMYITVVVVGSVFLLIISTIMSALGSNQTTILTIQIATVLILLPIASVMFIVIVKTISPVD